MLNPIRSRRQVGLFGVRANHALMPPGVAVAIVVMCAMTIRGIASVPPLPDFTVNLNPVSGRIEAPTLLVADKLTGNYNQVFTVTSPNTFAVQGYWDGGQLVHGDGTVPYTARESRLGVDYSLYALFSYSGTFAADGVNAFQFAATAGSFTLYVDRRTDTSKILPVSATLPIVLTGNAEDVILASATLLPNLAGRFQLGNPLSAGAFGLAFNPVVLTALGSRYFVAPAPFYAGMLFKGQFNSFDTSIDQQINGSADIGLQ